MVLSNRGRPPQVLAGRYMVISSCGFERSKGCGFRAGSVKDSKVRGNPSLKPLSMLMPGLAAGALDDGDGDKCLKLEDIFPADGLAP